jgi:peptidoglycan-associated lipoprotein
MMPRRRELHAQRLSGRTLQYPLKYLHICFSRKSTIRQEDRMRRTIVCLLLILGVMLFGCAQRKVTQQLQPGDQQQRELSDAAGKDKKGVVKPEERITEQQLAKVEAKEEPSRYKEESGLFEDVYFDFDKYDIRPEAKPVLNNVSSWLLKNPATKLSVEGHCDERGTNEYNLALGDRRAKSVRDFLIALGVASKRIEIVSYGEEKPQCTEQTEECWAKNRRSHFVVLR